MGKKKQIIKSNVMMETMRMEMGALKGAKCK